MSQKLTVDNAWKGRRVKPYEWLRDEASARKGQIREEEAEYAGVIMHEEGEALGRVATFFSDKTGKRYDCAERLAPKGLVKGDRVHLVILGCCSIAKIIKIRGMKERDKSKLFSKTSTNGSKKNGEEDRDDC